MTHTTKQTHTPGPWSVDEESKDNAGQLTLAITSDNRPGYVCGIHCAEGVDLDIIDRTNAALIASAPELLAALEELMRNLRGMDLFTDEQGEALSGVLLADKALAKAKGGA